MRNWCLAAALGVFLASPLCAQQEAAGMPDNGSGRAETAAEKSSGGASNAVANDHHALSKDVLALPAVPRPKPFPKPQAAAKKATKNDRAPGRLLPRYE